MTQIADISIRNEIRPGDLGQIIYLHGVLYSNEFKHGISFESIVAGGLHEFYSTYNPKNERIWIAEHNNQIVGTLLLKNRGSSAQLRYYLIKPEYRGLGLGNKLMQLFMNFAKKCEYSDAYLWTTNELGKAAHLYTKFGFKLTEEKPSVDFGKQLTEQRYDLKLKVRFLNIENTAEIFEKLAFLNEDTQPLFGKMTARQMVGHLTFVVRFSHNKDSQKLMVSEEEAERSKRFVVNTEKELPEAILFPSADNVVPQIDSSDLITAIKLLQQELEDFHNYFAANNEALTIHPAIGKLNYKEWLRFHNKHFTHHFKQFKLI